MGRLALWKNVSYPPKYSNMFEWYTQSVIRCYDNDPMVVSLPLRKVSYTSKVVLCHIV